MKPAGIAFLSGAVGLGVGLTVGFGAGVLSTKAGEAAFERLTSIEEAPDVAHPRRLVKPGFAVSYPGNWHLKPPDGKSDSDHVITLESHGADASVVFIVMDAPSDAKDNVERQRAQLTRKVLLQTTGKPFSAWGRYAGEGLELDGQLMGLAPGSARIFSASQQGRSFVAVEITGQTTRAIDLKSGFDLVERTFVLQPATR